MLFVSAAGYLLKFMLVDNTPETPTLDTDDCQVALWVM